MATRGETTRGASKALPPRETNSPVVNDAIARKQDEYEQGMVEMKTAQGDLAAVVIEIQRQQEEFAATLKAVTGQLMDAMEQLKQGQGAVGTGNKNNNGENTNELEEKQATGAAQDKTHTPARLNLGYIYMWYGELTPAH